MTCKGCKYSKPDGQRHVYCDYLEMERRMRPWRPPKPRERCEGYAKAGMGKHRWMPPKKMEEKP